jgi:hypothetical protein
MPRAENRKRPANSLGNVPGSGKSYKSGALANNHDTQNVQNNKQALLEKMKKLQENKKADS